MKKSVVIGCFLVLTFSIPATAEFYRYTDEHGNTIYTDDLNKVPPDQRDAVAAYETQISKPQPQQEEVKKSPSITTEDDNEKMRLKLDQRQKTLTQEYDALAAERDELNRAQKAAVTKLQIKDYNKKVVEFNARIKAYEEKRDAHTLEVETFNKRMAEKNAGESSQ